MRGFKLKLKLEEGRFFNTKALSAWTDLTMLVVYITASTASVSVLSRSGQKPKKNARSASSLSILFSTEFVIKMALRSTYSDLQKMDLLPALIAGDLLNITLQHGNTILQLNSPVLPYLLLT